MIAANTDPREDRSSPSSVEGPSVEASAVPHTKQSRTHSAGQLILLAALGTFNALLSLAVVYTYRRYAAFHYITGAAILVPLWGVWLSTLLNRMRGRPVGPPIADPPGVDY